ncbi:MAG: hypothetical protein RQ879_01220 [Sulfolobales archaeon]|nr:hypothetical protein [Sulfolobales archaeon]
MDKVQVVKILALQATQLARTSIYDSYVDASSRALNVLYFNNYAVTSTTPDRDFFVGTETQLDHLLNYVLEKYQGFIELTLVINSPVNISEIPEKFNGIINVVCLNLVEGCELLVQLVKRTGGVFVFTENLGILEKILNFLLNLVT